jgi:hypothetical protein
LMKGFAASKPPATTSFIGLGLALVIDEGPGVLAGAGLDHGDGNVTVLDDAACDHDLEDGAITLAPAREGDPLAVDERQAHAGDRAAEGQTGDQRGCRSGVQRDHVIGVVRIDGEHGLHNLHLVAQRVREQGAQRAVDDAAGQDGLSRRAAFAAEERAGDLACCVHLLFDVDGQREEVVVLLGAGSGGRGGKHHRIVVEVGGYCAVRLLGQATRLEAQCTLAK